jgi:hypothetical protein
MNQANRIAAALDGSAAILVTRKARARMKMDLALLDLLGFPING